LTSPSLGSIGQRPSLRPDLPSHRPPRAGAVNDGRRPPPQAAHSVIDGPEHGGSIAPIREYASATINTVALPQAGEVVFCTAVRYRTRDVGALVVYDRYRPRPSCGCAMDLHWKTHHVEAIGRQLLQVVQLLQMRITDLTPRAMALPDQSGITRFGNLAPGVRERCIPAPTVGADQSHALVQQP